MADEEKKEGETPEQAEPTTQAVEEFDKERAMALIAKLRGEVKELTPKAKKAAELEATEAKRKEAEISEVEKLNKRLAEAESRLKEVSRIENQRTAAEKVGLPLAYAKRLQGETPEELEADAKEMLDALPAKPEKKPATVGSTNPSGGQQGLTLEQRLAKAHGTDMDLFDPKVMRELGGGVFINTKSTE